jgi:hypothetical protein
MVAPKLEFRIRNWMGLLNNRSYYVARLYIDNWDSYYLYSEFPSNIQGVKYIPFFKECV